MHSNSRRQEECSLKKRVKRGTFEQQVGTSQQEGVKGVYSNTAWQKRILYQQEQKVSFSIRGKRGSFLNAEGNKRNRKKRNQQKRYVYIST